ncbi:MAG: TonB-dependent receptor plug domain-containing protein [Pseudomonadota bacterium]
MAIARSFVIAWIGGCALTLAAPEFAQATDQVLQRIVVTGSYDPPVTKSGLSNDPAAGPASVSVLGYSEEVKSSVRDYSDLLKPAMGVSSNNFGQGGVGYGLTLRGFSSRASGSNTAISIDGVPINQPSNQLSNGYSYLQTLVPELADRFVLIRGPFDVRTGANQLAGSLPLPSKTAVVRSQRCELTGT